MPGRDGGARGLTRPPPWALRLGLGGLASSNRTGPVDDFPLPGSHRQAPAAEVKVDSTQSHARLRVGGDVRLDGGP